MNAPRNAPLPPVNRGPLPRFAAHRWAGDLLACWAVVSGLVVLVLAFVLPIVTGDDGRPGVQPRYSLYAAEGPAVLFPAAAPLLVAVLVTAVLHAGRHGTHRWALPTAWVLSLGLLCAAGVGFVTFLIGIYVVPTAVLLVLATGQAHNTSRAWTR